MEITHNLKLLLKKKGPHISPEFQKLYHSLMSRHSVEFLLVEENVDNLFQIERVILNG